MGAQDPVIANAAVAPVFAAYPPKLRKRLLADTFRGLFPKTFRFEGNRRIVFDESDRVPAAELKLCIGMALTYRQKRARDWNATS